MSTFFMYWIVKLDDLVVGCGILCAFSIVTFVVALFLYSVNVEYTAEPYDKIIKAIFVTIKASLLCGIISFICAVFIPNTKQICAIIVIPKVVNAVQDNNALMKIPDDIITLGSKWIQKMSSELDSTKVGKHVK